MRALSQTLLEAFLVVAAGTVIALAGNALSGRGLRIDRRYILEKPDTRRLPATRPGAEAGRDDGGGSDTPARPADGEDSIVGGEHWKLVEEYGLQPIEFEKVKQAYLGPEYEMGAIVFIDARNEDLYRKGRIPGALLCDRYRIDDYVGTVHEAVQAAFQVILYCGGGDCEDSLQTVLMLQGDATLIEQGYGFDPTKMFIYVGGLEEWEAEGGPIEQGERGGGAITGGFDE